MSHDSKSPLVATVVMYTVKPDKEEALRESVERHLVPAARQAEGYRGFLLLDQKEGKRLAVVLFDSPEHARAAQALISGAARDGGVYELMVGPQTESTRSMMGTAIIADGIFCA